MGLDYRTYVIEAVPSAPLLFPGDPGALLRGTFGAALRQLSCVTGAATCEGCKLARACRYRAIFDPLPPEGVLLAQQTQGMPPAYVLDPQAVPRRLDEGRPVRFGLTLLGEAHRHLALVVTALARAMTMGLARERTRLVLRAVEARTPEGRVHVKLQNLPPLPPTARLQAGDCVLPEDEAGDGRLHLRFLTPMALRRNGQISQADTLEAGPLLFLHARRVSMLVDAHGDGALGLDFHRLSALSARLRIASRRLEWRQWRRYSARQQREVPMGGLVGTVCIEGPVAPFLTLLRFGRDLHMGRHAAFGQGAYEFSVER